MNNTGNFYQELLQDDWLGRTPETYTFIKNGISMGWEQTLTKGTALSSFFLKIKGTPTMDKQLLLTKQACQNMFNRMNFTKKPARIIFSKEFKSYQQGNTLCVTVEPLQKTDSEFPTYNHRLDPILGYCIHETAHFLYTSQDYTDYILSLKGMEQRVKAEIMNILEDERIEQKVNVSFRGYTDYIGKAKDYAFDKKWKDEAGQKQLDTQNEMNQIFSQFLYLVRYPKALDEAMVLKFETELREIKKTLTPYPETIPELIVATDKIYMILDKYLDKTQNPTQSEQDDEDSNHQDDSQAGSGGPTQKGQPSGKGKGSKSGGSGGESDDNDSEDGDPQAGDSDGDGAEDDSQDDANKGSGKGKGKNGKPTDEEGEEDGDSDSDNDNDNDSAKGKPTQPKKPTKNKPVMVQIDPNADPITLEEALKEILDIYEMVTFTPEELGITPEDLAKILSRDVAGPIIKEINSFDNPETNARSSYMGNYPESADLGNNELSVIFKDASNLNASHNNYDKALAVVRPFATSLRAKIQQLNRNHEVILRGLSEGDFDDSMLVDSLVGAKNVYMESHKIKNRSAVVGLLIDESGSMDGEHIKHARQIAVMFERALTGVNNIDFYCYGHTTGASLQHGGRNSYDSTHINVYFEGMKKSDRYNLGKIHSHNTNRDGHAILEVVGRMRKTVSHEKPIILFMISDGAPSASVPDKYRGDGRAYTKKCVDTVQRTSNTQIIHIAIEEGIDSASMFTNYIKFTDPRTLVNDIGLLLKKVMLKQQQADFI